MSRSHWRLASPARPPRADAGSNTRPRDGPGSEKKFARGGGLAASISISLVQPTNASETPTRFAAGEPCRQRPPPPPHAACPGGYHETHSSHRLPRFGFSSRRPQTPRRPPDAGHRAAGSERSVARAALGGSRRSHAQRHPRQRHPRQRHPRQRHPRQRHPRQRHPRQRHPRQRHPRQRHLSGPPEFHSASAERPRALHRTRRNMRDLGRTTRLSLRPRIFPDGREPIRIGTQPEP
ncbi:hypothetical protein Hoch_2160 [Haliangium ochraceum DSM 14365]|uniref:Uncharacterized protein n=1 Tax=Haliangium ochraceum (strain DSM 14365 / JCM 11303 / SMP-2) TaxID=502025 RepID=D0LGY3_HALO1|nr:hypothetical protein Hoch_2160 [Haliangium ochraceum DSM 14365]